MVWTHFKNERRDNSEGFEHGSKRKLPKGETYVKMGTKS